MCGRDSNGKPMIADIVKLFVVAAMYRYICTPRIWIYLPTRDVQ